MARVMIVEDEPHIVESLKFLLIRDGFNVDAFEDGEQAYAALTTAPPPDVLVLDVMLPSLNGFELLRRIRAAAPLSKIPVLLLTAKGQRRDRECAMAAGADKFMTKPFSNAELVATVKELAG